MKIKETKTRISEDSNSTENVTTVGERSTGWLIVHQIRKKNKMTLKTSLWDPNFMEKSPKMATKKTPNNG